MKILMFNHHPDVLHYAWRAFTELGHEVELATEKLTKDIGFQYTSTKDNKFEVVDQLFEPGKLFADMKDAKFCKPTANPREYDLVWAMLPEITSLRAYGVDTWYDCQMQGTLRTGQIQSLPGIKTCNHPDATDFNFKWLPNWTNHQPDIIEPKYVTQSITELNLVDTTQELMELKKTNKIPVKIHGGKDCPDGFIRDINVLPHTALLVHNKDFGCNCYAVCKALDMGIPVYMSRKTKTRIGFDDLPDELFLFQEEYSIADAYKIVVGGKYDHHQIQETYRSIYTLERTVKAAEKILEEAGLLV